MGALVALCLGLAPVLSAAQVSLDRLIPISGPPGTTVSLHGAGFQGSLQIQLNGVNAAVTLSTSTQVNFTVPANAGSGFVSIQISNVWYVNPAPFTVTRPIQGVFNPPAGLSRTGYEVIADGEFIAVDLVTGQFNGAVAKENVSVLSVLRGATEPEFMALVPPQTSQPIIDAASTAEALVLLAPGVNGRALKIYTNRVVQLRALPEFAVLTNLVGTVAGAGRDYLDDARVDTALVNAVVALLSAPLPTQSRVRPAAFEPGTPRGTNLRYLDPPDTSNGTVGLRRLKAVIEAPDNSHPDHFRAEFKSAERFSFLDNPLDWFVKVYELDSTQFANGLVSVDALAPNDILAKVSQDPIATASVSADLLSKNLDVIDLLAGLAINALFGATVDELAKTPSEVDLRASRPGIYVVEAYNGNLNNGTDLLPAPSQSQLITDLGGRTTWAVSLGANITIAVVDLIGAAGGFIDVFKKARSRATGASNEGETEVLLKIFDGVAQDVTKGLAIHGNQPLTLDTFYDYVKNGVSSTVKNLLALALEKSDSPTLANRWATKAQKVIKGAFKFIDLAAKISSGLQAAERVSGLLAPSVLAVERSVVVVGNPFGPRITSFFPLQGRGGETLKIQGANFGSDTNDLKVSFRTFAGTDDPTRPTKQVDLQILTASPNSIAVLVPTNGTTEFPNLYAYVVVERGSSNLIGSSAVLNPPFREFRFLPPPTLTSVFPDPVHAGGVLELRGLGFDNETAREYGVLIDGTSQGIGRTADVGGNRMGFVVPSTLSTGLHNITIRFRGNTNGSIPFEVAQPAYAIPSGQFPGLSITVEKADFSDNTNDHKISVLEAFLILKGQHQIEQHLPCEFLPESDPNHCPFQEREIDHVGNGGGSVPVIGFPGDMVLPGPLPALTGGARYLFGTPGHPFIVDGSGAGAGAAGLLLDGTAEAYVTGSLVIRNFSGHGVHLRNGAQGNFLEGVTVQNCGGSGFVVEGGSTRNELRHVAVTNAAGHGVHFTGVGTERNNLASFKGNVTPPVSTYDVISNCGSNGIRVDGGASFNHLLPGTIRNCQAAGIHVVNATNNFFGRETEELRRHFDIVNNNGPGAYLGPGAVGNVLRYLNPISNFGDGVLLEGPGCSNNIVDRIYAGVNLYEGGTATTHPNRGSGICLTNGAQYNLVGTRIVTFGQHGSISGNRDDGVLLDGSNTAFNTVNAQFIGVLDPFAAVQVLKFAANGRSGIALRNGAHDNFIGDSNADLANAIFACSDAGIEITGAGTDNNYIFGNQIGAFFTRWVLTTGDPNRNRLGIWIHDGPRNNTIGLAGDRIEVPNFPGDPFPTPYQCWNAVNSCTEAGLLLEDAAGELGTDGVLVGANLIQANHIGELDNGNLAPSGEGAGIKLAAGAQANVIGGSRPEFGNRIRGWYRAGLWIDQNHLPSARLRNRIENNFIEGPGLGISFRFTDYLVNTPSGGVGILLTTSSGHQVGESQLGRNTLLYNRLGVYLADSWSNTVRGLFITNSYNAGLTIRGGEGNIIGGNSGEAGNLIHAFGFPGEPNWAGLALSDTTNNQVRANEIGFTASGRGAVGLYLTNAFGNEIGGPSPGHGNVVISNHTNGVVMSGTATAANKLFNNLIGRDRNGITKANRGDGVRLEAGAHDNFIGGLATATTIISNITISGSIPSGNVIVSNFHAGVRVVGTNTVGNRILYNEITGNGNKGILHEIGGNTLQPPPTFIAFDGDSVFGTVASLAVTPPGSRIQIFADPDATDPEGDAYMGEGTVRTNGTWQATLTGKLRHPILTMTATDGEDGSTSEFGTGGPTLIAFRIERTDSAIQGSLAAGVNDASAFRLSLSTVNADVRVKSIAFDTTGTLPDPTAVAASRLYEDTDRDGVITTADRLLADPVTFGADNGRITFANMNPVIQANSTQYWVVAHSLAPGAPVGSTFQLILTNKEVVVAEYVNPMNFDADPQGSFAIESANFTVGAAPAGQTFGAWAAGVFTTAQLADPNVSGPAADPDNDGLINLLEYAFNLNPLTADRDTAPTGDRGIPRGAIVRAFDPVTQSDQDFLEITFVRRKEPVDLNYQVEHSTDLQNWSDALAAPAVLAVSNLQDVGPPGTLERVTYRGTLRTGSSLQRFIRVRVQPKP